MGIISKFIEKGKSYPLDISLDLVLLYAFHVVFICFIPDRIFPVQSYKDKLARI
jgi:hypothetical protein